MTPDAARALKARGCWGAQDGLLSVSELVLLSEVAFPWPRVLEVGHYCGLSTAVLAQPGRIVVTVDSHQGDRWVPTPAGAERFLANLEGVCGFAPLFIDSRALVAPLAFPFVFYDGDHAEEQARFTQVVIDSPRVECFVFDDRDFPVPRMCCELLRTAGWRDLSPPLVRGPGDKRNPETMTLGVWVRP